MVAISYFCGCIYRSPTSSEENNGNLLKLMRHIDGLHYSHKVLIGNFNYKHINWDDYTTDNINGDKQSEQGRFLECVKDTYMHQFITTPTRICGSDQPSILDLIFGN